MGVAIGTRVLHLQNKCKALPPHDQCRTEERAADEGSLRQGPDEGEYRCVGHRYDKQQGFLLLSHAHERDQADHGSLRLP